MRDDELLEAFMRADIYDYLAKRGELSPDDFPQGNPDEIEERFQQLKERLKREGVWQDAEE